MIPAQPVKPQIDWDAQVSLKQLVESAPIALALVDSTGQLVYVNARLEELFGYEQAELVGQTVEVLLPERFQRVHQQHRYGYMQQPHVRIMGSGLDLAGRRKDGSEFPLEAGLSHLTVGNETVVITMITDISKRKQTEELLERRVEERTREIKRRHQVAEGLRSILEILNSSHSLAEILNFIVGQACWLLQADACAIYGRDAQSGKLVVQASSGMLASDLAQADTDIEQTLLLDQPRIIGEYETQQAGQAPTQLLVPLKVRTEAYGVLLISYHTARPFANEELQLAMSVANHTALAIENTHLHTQIEQTAVAAERNRIARDLHDAVTQTLFSASMIAQVLPRIWQRNQAEGERRLAELRELTRGALAEMRTLLLELRPAKLMEVELADLLRQLAEAIAGRARVAINVQIEGEVELPPDVKIAFYRIAQEALNNVGKHAQAQHAEVRLLRQPTGIELQVTDDGNGFVLHQIRPEHLGLSIMRERADAIGATLQIQSQPNQGATVTVRWTPASDKVRR